MEEAGEKDGIIPIHFVWEDENSQSTNKLQL